MAAVTDPRSFKDIVDAGLREALDQLGDDNVIASATPADATFDEEMAVRQQAAQRLVDGHTADESCPCHPIRAFGMLLHNDETVAAGTPLTARKLGMYLPVTCCMLTDSTGENHCQHPLPELKPRPWTWRLYDWWWDLRERAGRRVAGWRWPEDAE